MEAFANPETLSVPPPVQGISEPLPLSIMTTQDTDDQESELSASGKSGRFPDTRWSLISAVRDGNSHMRERALADLCRIYWIPIYAFARRRGCDIPLAEDLTQDLFVKFLSRNSFEGAKRDLGRLRTYLLTSMTRLMASDACRNSAKKRNPQEQPLSIERDFAEGIISATPAGSAQPEEDFDRHWAQAMLREVESRLEKEYSARSNQAQFNVLKKYLLAIPRQGGYGECATDLGISEGAIKVAVFRMRKRFKALLRDEVAQTVTDHESVEDELKHLQSSLAAVSARKSTTA
jgi:RNA polymerase sigma factor (sigma-70 family)